jgi:hypothetical protein
MNIKHCNIFILFFITDICVANIISVNPGAETNDLTGWSVFASDSGGSNYSVSGSDYSTNSNLSFVSDGLFSFHLIDSSQTIGYSFRHGTRYSISLDQNYEIAFDFRTLTGNAVPTLYFSFWDQPVGDYQILTILPNHQTQAASNGFTKSIYSFNLRQIPISPIPDPLYIEFYLFTGYHEAGDIYVDNFNLSAVPETDSVSLIKFAAIVLLLVSYCSQKCKIYVRTDSST